MEGCRPSGQHLSRRPGVGSRGKPMSVLDQPPSAGPGRASIATPTLTDRPNELSVVRPRTRWQRGYVHRCMAVDFFAALVGGTAAYVARWGDTPKFQYLVTTALLPLVWLAAV